MKLPWNRNKTDKAEVPNIDANTADADWLIAQAREGEQRVFKLPREGHAPKGAKGGPGDGSGPGSGNWGHAGDPPNVGGSAPGGGGGNRMQPKGALGRAPVGNAGVVGHEAATKLLNIRAGTPWETSTAEDRAALKGRIIEKLAREAHITSEETDNVVFAWASSSSDENPASLAMQSDAAKEFGIDMPPQLQERLDKAWTEEGGVVIQSNALADASEKFASQREELSAGFRDKLDRAGLETWLADDVAGGRRLDRQEMGLLTEEGGKNIANAYQSFVRGINSIDADVRAEAYRLGQEQLQTLPDIVQNDEGRDLLVISPESTQRSVLRLMYDETQAALRAQNVGPNDLVRVYRGMGTTNFHATEGVGRYRMNPLSSWSVSRDVADKFAEGEHGVILTMDVPAQAIMSTAATGIGCLNEGELVLLGTGEHEMLVERARGQKIMKKPSQMYVKAKDKVLNIDADTDNADWLIAQAREGEQAVFDLMRENRRRMPKASTKARLGDVDTYARHLHNYAAALWRGDIDVGEFVSMMVDEIEPAMKAAWIEGMGECGLTWDDMLEDEIATQQDAANGQFEYLPDYAAYIVAHNKEAGTKLGDLDARTALWVNRWGETRGLATITCCGDEKMRWTVHPEKEHCASCLKLDGIVKRAKYWDKQGIVPREAGTDKLDCGGWNCGCSLDVTDDPVTPGPLPPLP